MWVKSLNHMSPLPVGQFVALAAELLRLRNRKLVEQADEICLENE